jgi:hypothetical protein
MDPITPVATPVPAPAPEPEPQPVPVAALPAQLPGMDEDDLETVGALARISRYEKDVRIGTGRPIFHRDTEIRRELLSVIPSATELGAPMARAVVAPRRVGSIEDLLALVPAQRRATVAYPDEPAPKVVLEKDMDAEGEEVVLEFADDLTSPEDYAEPDLRPLWRKAAARMTPARVIALSAITVALFVGSTAWNAAVPVIGNHHDSKPTTPAVTNQVQPPVVDPAGTETKPAKKAGHKKTSRKKASAASASVAN